MALPNQLKSARITGASAVSGWPTALGQLEQAMCDILGITIDVNVSSPIGAKSKFAIVSDSTAVSNTASETAFSKSYTISANTLAAGDLIRVTSMVNVTNTTGGTVNYSTRARVGGSTGMPAMASLGIVTGNTYSIYSKTHFYVRSIGAAANIAVGECWFMPPTGPAVAGALSSLGAVADIARDSTGALVVDQTITLGTASVNASAVLHGITVEILSAASTA